MKYCAKCGNANVDEAMFCASCGSPVDQAPAAPQTVDPAPAPAPEQPAYSASAPSTYAAPAYDQAYSGAAVLPKNSSTLWMILNIVATLFCCPGALFSIVGLVFAILGMGSYNKGDYEDMKKKTKISMILFIVGAVFGLLCWIIGGIVWVGVAIKNQSIY